MDVSYLLFPFTASFNLNTEKGLGTSAHASSGFQDGSRHGFLLTVTTGKTLSHCRKLNKIISSNNRYI